MSIWNLNAVHESNILPKIVSSGLLMHVDANLLASYPGSGSTWFDLSGNGNNGTIQSGVTYNAGGYFTFNGTSGYVSFPLLTTATSNITMMAFVNMPASDGGAIFYNGNSGGYGFGIGTNTFDSAGNDITGLFQFVRFIDTSFTWGTGWMLVGMVLNGNTPQFYRHGAYVTEVGGTGPNTPTTNTILGSDQGGGRYFAGSIAWAAFYNRVLTGDEWAQNLRSLQKRYGLV